MKKLFLLLVTVVATTLTFADNTRIFCRMQYSWWTKDGAAIGIILDSGTATRMALVPGKTTVWYADVDLSNHTTVKFRRINGSGTIANWGAETTAQNIADNGVGTTYNYFTISNSSDTWSGNGNYCTGSWSVYSNSKVVVLGGFNGWGGNDEFTDNGETASFTKTITAGTYAFKITVGGNWRSYATTIRRTDSGTAYDFSDNPSDATLVADIDGDYVFTYDFWAQTLSITYPDWPEQSVDFDGLEATVMKGSTVNFAATSSGIANPGYRYFVKPKGGSYGSAVTSYTFDALGEYVVKVEALANNTGSAVASKEANVKVYETHTFAEGTTIYIDFQDVSGDVKGVNFPFVGVTDGLDYDASGAGTIKTVTFSKDVTWSTLKDFIKTEKAGWKGLKFSVPAGNRNVAKVAADGASYEWILVPDASLTGLDAIQLVGEQVTIGATTNLSNPVYTYQIKIGDGEYQSLAANPYTFAATGTYTFKVSVTGDEGNAEATKQVAVYEPLTIYFVNHYNDEEWDDVSVYLYTKEKTAWPGDPMTLTAVTTARSGYEVYSFTFGNGAHANAIFNNNSNVKQTANLTIDPAKPYFYDGTWYATLAECDQPDLTTGIYLLGSFNNWNPTANQFLKAAEDATEASVTLTIEEYSAISFKTMDNGNWRGCQPQKTITKDDNSVTILADAEGSNVAMTPYAAGDYVFTLDLDSRLLTVTYPDGEQMPIPTNIFLAGDVLTDWNGHTPAYKFVVDQANDVATLEVELEANKDYAFKLVYNDAWLGAQYNFNYYWRENVTMIVDDTQANLYAFNAGTYTFRYSLSTSKLSIDFPQSTDYQSVSISDVEYATLYSDQPLDVPEDVDAYILTGYEGIKLVMERIEHIPAQTGVLLHGAEGTYNFYLGDGRYMNAVSTNLLKGSLESEVIDNLAVHYVLSYDNEHNVGFFWPYGTGANQGVGSFSNNANKAYIELNEPQPAPVAARRGFRITGQTDVVTEVENTNRATPSCAKILRNGTLLLIRDTQMFNAQGIRIQ